VASVGSNGTPLAVGAAAALLGSWRRGVLALAAAGLLVALAAAGLLVAPGVRPAAGPRDGTRTATQATRSARFPLPRERESAWSSQVSCSRGCVLPVRPPRRTPLVLR
jgi:hypothetical protein